MLGLMLNICGERTIQKQMGVALEVKQYFLRKINVHFINLIVFVIYKRDIFLHMNILVLINFTEKKNYRDLENYNFMKAQ